MTYRDIIFISFHQYNLFVTYNDIIFILFHRQLITNLLTQFKWQWAS